MPVIGGESLTQNIATKTASCSYDKGQEVKL